VGSMVGRCTQGCIPGHVHPGMYTSLYTPGGIYTRVASLPMHHPGIYHLGSLPPYTPPGYIPPRVYLWVCTILGMYHLGYTSGYAPPRVYLWVCTTRVCTPWCTSVLGSERDNEARSIGFILGERDNEAHSIPFHCWRRGTTRRVLSLLPC